MVEIFKRREILSTSDELVINEYHVATVQPPVLYAQKKVVLLNTTGMSDIVLHDLELFDTMLESRRYLPHYFIAKNGDVFEVRKPEYWDFYSEFNAITNNINNSYKTVKASRRLDVRAVIIELSNLGPLFHTKFGIRNVHGIKPEDAYYFKNKFRGFDYYDKYTTLQIESLRKLLTYLRDNVVHFYYKYAGWFISGKLMLNPTGLLTPYIGRNDIVSISPQQTLIDLLEQYKNPKYASSDTRGIIDGERMGEAAERSNTRRMELFQESWYTYRQQRYGV